MAEVLTVEEVSRRSKLGEKAVRGAIRRGDLRASKLCGRWRVRESDYDDWFERGRCAALTPVVDDVSAAPAATGSLAALRRIEGEAAA